MSRHDLWRLILKFRDLVEAHGERCWFHMEDWDLSFEQPADAVDHANAALFGYGPDYRMRCDLSPAYRWPSGAPYDGKPVIAVRVRDAYDWRAYGSHYRRGHTNQALCGFSFAPEEAKRITSEPNCRECLRELALAKALRADGEDSPE
ncbi:hypothetical protein NE236_40225 [Actinoallomurus purpureus]|uniref:hypothetical protein n=1 Tax=Actinoallomurus purpureus TaxID=478114 RepID=UPI0020936404|nr:hypothetical protein [Actinoallomurus purpureus]MCO6011199.1 hypothetical protein [Actinoallomurus purpureus]